MLNRKGKGLSRSLLVGITDEGVDRNGNGGLIIMQIDGYRQSINLSLKLQTGVPNNDRGEGANHNTSSQLQTVY